MAMDRLYIPCYLKNFAAALNFQRLQLSLLYIVLGTQSGQSVIQMSLCKSEGN